MRCFLTNRHYVCRQSVCVRTKHHFRVSVPFLIEVHTMPMVKAVFKGAFHPTFWYCTYNYIEFGWYMGSIQAMIPTFLKQNLLGGSQFGPPNPHSLTAQVSVLPPLNCVNWITVVTDKISQVAKNTILSSYVIQSLLLHHVTATYSDNSVRNNTPYSEGIEMNQTT